MPYYRWGNEPTIRYNETPDYWCKLDGHSSYKSRPPPVFNGRKWTEFEILTRGEHMRKLCHSVILHGVESSLEKKYDILFAIDEILRQITRDWKIKPSTDGFNMLYQTFMVKEQPTIAQRVEGLLSKLTQQHEAVRDAINEQHASTDYSRPFRFMKLPPGVIDNILSYCEPFCWDEKDFYGPGTAFGPPQKLGLACIKALRLTCRTLNERASPFLLREVMVRITPDSLARLKQISEHPNISAGVRSVRLILSYPLLQRAQRPTTFVQAAASNLLKQVQCYEPEFISMQLEILGIGNQWEQAALHVERKQLLPNGPLWKFGASEVWPLLQQELYPNEYPMLQKAFVSYNKLYDDYKQARLVFGSKVSNAMSRMPQATRLEITDESFQYPFTYEGNRAPWYYFDEYHGEVFESDRKSLAAALKESFQDTHNSFSWGNCPPNSQGCPVEILLSLPSQLAARGIQLTRLEIKVSSPPAYPINYPSDANFAIESNYLKSNMELNRLVSRLRYFKFSVDSTRIFDYDDYEDDELDYKYGVAVLHSTTRLIDQCISSPVLGFLELNMKGLSDFMEQEIGAWELKAYHRGQVDKVHWKELEHVNLCNTHLSMSEMIVILRSKPRRFTLHNIYLVNGTWAKALDILRQWWQTHSRAKTKSRFNLRYPVSDELIMWRDNDEVDKWGKQMLDYVLSKPESELKNPLIRNYNTSHSPQAQ